MLRIMTRLAGAAVILAAIGQTMAHDYRLGGLRIDHPHANASLPGAVTAAGYASFINEGSTDVLLTGASSDAAERVEIHESTIEDGIARMRPVDRVVIPAGGTVDFAPRSHHLMLFGLRKPFAEGDKVKLVLSFEDEGGIEIELAVHAPSGSDHPH